MSEPMSVPARRTVGCWTAALVLVLLMPALVAADDELVGPLLPGPRFAAATQQLAAPTFRAPFILNAHAPDARFTNVFGGPAIEHNASVATDTKGHWVAVWHSTDPLGGAIGRDWDILVATSDDNGLTWISRGPLNTSAAGDSGDDLGPVVRTDGKGVWVTVWSSTDTFDGKYGMDADVWMARSVDNGGSWTEPVPLNVNAARDWGQDTEPRIATDGNGNWAAVWSSTDSLTNRVGGDSDIFVARSKDNGQTWTHPIPLNANATTDRGFDASPDIVTDGNGRWIAVWSSGDSRGGSIGTDRDILLARSDDQGASWTEPEPLNSTAMSDANSDWTPRIASDRRGSWLAVWSSAESLGDTIGVDRDILYARSTDDGNTWSQVRPLNSNAATDAREDSSPTVASDGAGRWLVAWHAWGGLTYGDGGDADIDLVYSADAGITWTPPFRIVDDAQEDGIDELLPSLATDGAGHWVAVWQSFVPPPTPSTGAEWRMIVAAGDSDAEARAALGVR